MGINYTIIIPHKNSSDLLAYCLSTIPIRDDVQVIVVDDNSDSCKVDFEHFPQWGGDNYECYFTKEGKGGGYARNVGLSHAKGKWVLFVDADDFLLPSVSAIFDNNVDADVDVIYFRPYAVMLADRQTPSRRADGYNSLIDDYYDGNENNIRCRFFAPWSKIVRKSLIDNYCIRFDEIPFSNDVLFSVTVGCNAKSILVNDVSFYVVTQSSDSLTSRFLSKPGELSVRAKAFFDAQKIVFESGYAVDNYYVIFYLRILYKRSREEFFHYLKFAQFCGYSKVKLINEIFRDLSLFQRLKCSLFVLCRVL